MPLKIERAKAPDRVSAVGGSLDSLSAQMFPGLFAFIVTDRWEDDGKPRQTASLLFFVEDGTWKGYLNDRAQNRGAFVSGADPLDVLEKMEGALQKGTLDWRKAKRR